MIGVERTDMRSKTNAANSKIVNGVAGLNILRSENWSFKRDSSCRRPQDAASGKELRSLNAQGSVSIFRWNEVIF
jgi:hypothetical protein